MARVPKPMIGLLVGTVVFFAIWIVALKPSSSSSGGSQGLGQFQSAINKAHHAVTTSSQANAKLGAPTATTPPATTPAKTAKTAKPAPEVKTATKPAAKAPAGASTQPPVVSAATGVKAVQNAIAAHKVVAVLFYNGAAADDRAVRSELAALPTHGGQVVKLAVPVSELTEFAMITAQVPVVTAPTLVIVDAARQATTITGFASAGEVGQRIADALVAGR